MGRNGSCRTLVLQQSMGGMCLCVPVYECAYMCVFICMCSMKSCYRLTPFFVRMCSWKPHIESETHKADHFSYPNNVIILD